MINILYSLNIFYPVSLQKFYSGFNDMKNEKKRINNIKLFYSSKNPVLIVFFPNFFSNLSIALASFS